MKIKTTFAPKIFNHNFNEYSFLHSEKFPTAVGSANPTGKGFPTAVGSTDPTGKGFPTAVGSTDPTGKGFSTVVGSTDPTGKGFPTAVGRTSKYFFSINHQKTLKHLL